MTSVSDAQHFLDKALKANVMQANCPSRAILTHVTSRWGTLVLIALMGGTQRFSMLRRKIGGISERMLAQTLQTLEADGLLIRHAHAVVPPHVDYALTPLGQEVAARVMALARWIEDNLPQLLQVQSPGAPAAPSTVAP